MKLIYEPALPETPPARPLVQDILLQEGNRRVGSARWQAGNQGVAQLLDIDVELADRRQGIGQRLINAVASQARMYFKRQGQPFRRLWIGVEQKSQVTGRAFLTDQGFHHIATVQDLFADQDLLIYSKAFD